MDVHRHFSGLMILTLLLPTMLAGSAAPTRASESPRPTAHGRTLSVEKTTDGLSLRPFPEAGYEERSHAGKHELTDVPSAPPRDLSVLAVRATAGSHTWDTDADFAGGAFDHTEVVSGTGHVTLLRRWSANIKANDDTGSAYQDDPSLAADGSGSLYLAWGDERNGDYDVYFAHSADGGVTWSTNVKVNDDAGSTAQYNPSLAMDGSGDLYLAWHDGRNGGRDIYFSKSVNGGATWGTNVQVNSGTGSAAEYIPNLAIDDDGTLYVAWHDNRSASWGIYFSQSTDGGSTWSTEIKVNDNSADADRPSLAAHGSGNVYLSWADARNDWRDIYFRKSTDGGVNWETSVRINDNDTGAIENRPSLAVDPSGRLYIVWEDSRSGSDGIYFARSTDGGTTWGENIPVNHDPSLEWYKPRSAVDGKSNVYVTWTDVYCNPYYCYGDDIYFAKSTNGGATWGTKVQANDDAGFTYQQNPSLAVGGSGNVYLAWEDERNGSSNDDIYTTHWPDNAHFHTGGSYTADYDAGDIVAWNSLAWTSTLPASTAITLAARVGNTPTVDLHWGGWVTFTTSPADLSALPPARYLQWQVQLSSPISTTTPALDAVAVAWDGFDYTQVGGTLSSDAIWTATDSPYLASGNVVVGQGVTLTLEPGTEVWFEDDRVLNVMGTLVAQGTATQPITFTSWHVQKQKDDWGAIAFAHTAVDATFDARGNYLGGSALMNATIEYAGAGDFDYAVEAANTAVYVDHCTIRQNGTGGIRAGGSESHITNNTISGNTAVDKGGGIYNTGSNTAIKENTIIGNGAADGGGIANDGDAATIGHNIIEDNQASNEGGGIFNAQPSATVYGNTISGNTAGVQGGGITWEGSDGDIVYNTILNNNSSGNTGGIYIHAGNNYPAVHYNTIQDNSGYAVYDDNDLNLFDPTHLNARYNWWGTTDEVAILDFIYDGLDNPDKSLVDYSPYLIEQPDLSPDGVNVSGRTVGLANTAYSFDASVYPIAAMPPLTYTWQATGQAPVTHVDDDLHDTASFTWTASGSQVITVTARNSKGVAIAVHSITITEISSQDAYEVDDTCIQARAITTTGDSQIHTFHTVEDIDWVSFPAVNGTTYVIEAVTPDDSEADVTLELYDDCVGDPQDSQNPAFSPNVRVSFIAPQDGLLYLRLADNRDTVGDRAATYHLSVRALPQTPPTGVLVLVAGKNKENDTVQSNIYHVTNAVYRLFRDKGYTADDIYYLAPETSLDADGDGNPDVTQESTKDNLQDAITTWAASKVEDANDTLTLYMMDHGGYDVFYLNYLDNQAKTVSAYELDGWLDTLEAAAPGVQINVIVEACQSGSFVDPPQSVSQLGRVVIASTGAHQLAYASQQGATFSDAFLVALGQQMNLNGSFAEARWAVQQAHPLQTPWLDDNGDGVPNGEGDGDVAVQRGFAVSFGAEDWPPYIVQATVNQATGRITAEVRIEGSHVVSEVWALLYAPSYEPPESGEDLGQESVPKVMLADPDQDSIYTATTTEFVEEGIYRVVIYAVDDMGLSARPKQSSVTLGEPFESIYLSVILRSH